MTTNTGEYGRQHGRERPGMPAQVVLARLAPRMAAAADEALTLGPEEVRSTTPELELYALSHPRADARLFAT